MTSSCLGALYTDLLDFSSWCCEISPVSTYCVQSKLTFRCLGTDDLQWWVWRSFFPPFCEASILDGPEVVERFVQGHTHKLKGTTGCWTREFWLAWLKWSTPLFMVFSFLTPLCLCRDMDYYKSEVFLSLGGWVSVELKCPVGTLCHFKLPRKVSSFVSAKGKLCDPICVKSLTSPPSSFSVFVSTRTPFWR